jgi:membrane-associated protein
MLNNLLLDVQWADVWELLKKLVNPESIIHYGGIALLIAVIFMENGVFFGFFLPGDSLLFTAGLLTSTKVLDHSLQVILLSIGIAAFLGYAFGYYFGWQSGKKIYNKKDTLFFKHKHVEMAQDYYERYGGKTLIIGRFLPIIRTFAPIVAGVIRMDLKKFMLFNLVGAVIWPCTIVTIGFYVGETIPNAEQHLGYVIIALIVLTSIPIGIEIKKSRKKSKAPIEPPQNL